ncbi:DUF6884 domain-containing protein [Pirellulaceae bacterium SH449]
MSNLTQQTLPFPKKTRQTIALVGCSKTKSSLKSHTSYFTARELYTSDLFEKRVVHVESRNLPWYILSAKSGLLKPTTPIRPYDVTFDGLSEIEAAEWHIGVANQLMTELYYEFNSPKLADVTIELHAGAKYCEPLGSILTMFGINVVKPVSSLGIGKQLAFYKGARA